MSDLPEKPSIDDLPGGDKALAWQDARLSLCGDRRLLCIVPDGERRRLLVWI